jgi:methyl-accepting chemotaxis protein
MELESLEIKIQAQAQQASGQIDALVTRLGRLSSALSGLSTGNLNSLSTGVNRLAGAMTAMRGIDTRTFSAVARNVSKLGSINSKQINAAAGSMRQISNAVKGLSGMSASVKGLTDLASAIKQLGYQSSTKAIENIPKLATAMRQLMSELSKAPMVSQNLINMTNALAKLARTGGAAGTAAKSITSSFSGFSSGASAVTKKSFSLASAIGKVYATYWTLFRGFRLLGDAIDISSSLTEVENVVRQTFGQYESLINNFAKTSIEKFGMSELSAKQFASRFQAMGTALDIPQGKMAKMSIRLTELAGDMASFYDVSQEDIAKSLQSVFSGTTAPMRRYGIDLTQATLKEWALKQGLDANISSMTQAQKAMLRYQYVLAHTTNITGDFARTADTWHNQITMLKENFKALGAVVGGGLINAFKPFIKVLNAVLQKVIAFAEMVTNALGSIFGWKYEASKGAGISGLADDIGSASDGMDDLSNAAGNAGKNTGGIAKNAKKAKKEIQQATRAFDELKVISKQSKDKGSGSGNKGSGSGSGSGAGGGTGADGGLVQTDTIFKKFKSNIKDLEELGKAISGALINAMRGIKWDEVYAKASGFGSGLAKFLNGLFKGQKGTTLFGETGRLIANSLNTVLHGLDSFGTTFDWKQFGNSIADGINKFFQNFDFALLAQTLNAWAQGAFDAVTTALSKISWKDVWNGAKEFLSNLDVKTVAIIVGALTIKKILGLHLAKTALGIIGTSISKAIAGSIAAKLGVEIGANATIGEVLSTGLSKKISGLGTIAGKIGKLALTVGAIVITAEAGLSLGKAIGNKIADATQPEEMKKYRVDFKFSDLFTYSLDDWKQGFSDWWNDTWGPGLAAWWEDRKAGNTKLKIPFTDFELPSDNEVKKAVSDWWDKQKKKIEKRTENVIKFTADVKDTSSKWWSNVKKWWGEKVGKVKEFTTDVKDSAKEWWSNTKKYWGQKVGQVKKFTTAVQNDASKWWNNTKKYWAEKVGKVKEFTTGVKNKAGEWWSNVKKWWESTTVGKEVKRFTVNVKKAGGTWWKDVSNEWKEKVVNAGRTLKIGISFATNALKNLWSSVSTFFSGKTVNVKTKGSTTKKADGGVFSGGSWKPIKKYAVGGLPNMGQMFVAREAGPELVGTLGGHTAVMNNDQIVQSVSDGVYRAVLAAMRGQKTSSGSQPVQIVLDGKVIFDSTRQSAQEYFNRTGMSPFPV